MIKAININKIILIDYCMIYFSIQNTVLKNFEARGGGVGTPRSYSFHGF